MVPIRIEKTKSLARQDNLEKLYPAKALVMTVPNIFVTAKNTV